jgi:hypothetical protein
VSASPTFGLLTVVRCGAQAIDRVYAGAAEPPVLLRELRAAAAAGGESGAAARAALAAYGLMASFLAANMLGDALLPHARVTELCEGVRYMQI